MTLQIKMYQKFAYSIPINLATKFWIITATGKPTPAHPSLKNHRWYVNLVFSISITSTISAPLYLK